MKVRKVLLIIILAVIATILLQVNVKAEEIDYSEYDYLLTEEGVVAQSALTGTEAVIAGIKGDYTGTIEANLEDKELILTNFVADGLDIVSEYEIHGFEINGENSVDYIGMITNDKFDGFMLKVWGNGILTFKGYMMVDESYNDYIGICTGSENTSVYVGTYIDEMKNRDLDADRLIVANTIKPNYERYIELFGLDVDEIILWMGSEGYAVTSSMFKELAKYPNTSLRVLGDDSDLIFKGNNIINSNIDFKTGLSISENPLGEMLDTKKDDVIYINFAHSGAMPGPIIIDFDAINFVEGDILKCYYYNKTTNLYERVEDAKMISNYELQLNIDHCSSFVVSKTELPAELVSSNENANKKGCIETEIGSLVWTEEDTNKILAAIEETRNNTTDKKLYVHVPSGSKVPAKIFEASKGIDITIISDDGIWAGFSGGNYKAIDYVAGGIISNKAIDGMVNVGEDNIVYLSLKHEGDLPSKCCISYSNGLTEIGSGFGEECNTVETKLYYFNKGVQKYELCGKGYMDLAYDLYVFEIDHCSSYVMSEEPLPDEFVIASTTGGKKEETKKEDTTKAPGKIPYAGGTTVIVISMIVIGIMGTFAYIKSRELKGI